MRSNRTISVNTDEYNKFLEECKKRDISVSAALRKLIRKQLKDWQDEHK